MAAADRKAAEPRHRERGRQVRERRRQVDATLGRGRPPGRGEEEAERHREHGVPKRGIKQHPRLGADDAGVEGGPSQMSQGCAEPQPDHEAGAIAGR
jgi:hypothetical protein